MRRLRQIVYKTLVEQLGVDGNMLSRVEGNAPIGIELIGGEEIFIYLESDTLQVFIEIPFNDIRLVINRSASIISALSEDSDIYLNIRDDKIALISELNVEEPMIESILAKKLNLFNSVVHKLKNL